MAIREKKGRRWSERTDEEDVELLSKQFGGLDESERALLEAVMAEMREGEDDILDFSAQHVYERESVTMEQFLDDDYYLGDSTKTLYPKVRDDLILIAETPSIREAVLTGSLGYGKTTMGSILMCWTLYQLSCLRSPQLAFGLSPGSEMVLATISKNLHLARTVLKSAIEDKLKLSPYFTKHFAPKRWGGDVTQFPKNIQLSIGSCLSERVLGMNVFAGVMDEANFMATKGQQITATGSGKKTVAQYDLAEKVYASLVRRIKSRFQRSGGSLPGMMVLLSSANVTGSFTDRKIADVQKNKDATVFVRDYATWDVKPKEHFSGDTFSVVVGSSSLRSRVVPKEEEATLDESFIEREGGIVLKVPEEYRPDFERDLENSIRDIAGMSTHAISAYLNRIETLEWAVSSELKHPFTVQEYTYGEPGGFLWENLCVTAERKLPGGYVEECFKPKRDPNALRWIHIDPALSGDCLGMAMGYIRRWIEVVRRNEDGEEYNDVAPEIVIEFMLRIHPPPGDQIFLPDVRRMCYELMDHGFHLMGFSCDRFQSAETLQHMKRKGVKAELLSVDLTTEPYDNLKSALYEARLKTYDYEPFTTEMKALEYDRIKGKIDHPVAGSKDCSDAVAGVVHGLMRGAKRMPVSPSMGTELATSDDDMSWVNPDGLIPVGPDFDVGRAREQYGAPGSNKDDPFGGHGGLFPIIG